MKNFDNQIYYYGHGHPISESMFIDPPNQFSFTYNIDPSCFTEYTKPAEYEPLRRAMVKNAGRIFNLIQTPRMVPIIGDYDIIHTDGSVIPLTRGSWIASMEYPSAFFSFNNEWFNNKIKINNLRRQISSDRCKGLVAYSSASLELLKKVMKFKSSTLQKLDVLYPAISKKYLLDIDRKENDKIRILFVGNHFVDKGGRELFRAFVNLEKKYDIELVLVTSAPPHHKEILNYYINKFKKHKNIKFYSNVDKKILWNDLFRKSDIFCFPSYMETFGYVLLEAMANKLAIVSSKQFAIPEIIDQGKTGLLVDIPASSFTTESIRSTDSLNCYRETVIIESRFNNVVSELEKNISLLIEDSGYRKRLARDAFKEVGVGKFSSDFRNRKLTSIYESALRR